MDIGQIIAIIFGPDLFGHFEEVLLPQKKYLSITPRARGKTQKKYRFS